MKKKSYFFAAGIVVIIGVLTTWLIILFLPKWIGSEVNPNTIIDTLESQGWLNFQAEDIAGQAFNLNDYKGKVVILGFWASWCAPCLEEFPSQLALAKKFPDKIVFVAVSADSAQEEVGIFLDNFKEQISTNTRILWDKSGEIAKLYKVGKLPENFVFGRNTKLSRKVIGSIDWNSEDAISFFEKL